MSRFWDTLFGIHVDSDTISVLQMTTRAALVFFIGLVLIRLAGQRTFGGNTPFDMVLKIMLGAVLARAVVAASPFWGTTLAALVLVALHRLVAWASARSHLFGQLMKGRPVVLAEDGKINEKNLAKSNLSKNDLLAGVREKASLESLDEAETVRLERNGNISVVKKE